MNVSLTPELERYVQKKVETGRYNSASEVIREALRTLEREEQQRGDVSVGAASNSVSPARGGCQASKEAHR